MGLNAVVFKNVRELEKEFGNGLFEVDEATGEAVLKLGKHVMIPRAAFFATRERIGNVSEVECLRGAVEEVLASERSIIRSRILYSAFHSGDSITLSDLSQLQEEIRILKSHGLAKMKTFIDTMESLVMTAQAEGNPIVFA